MMKIAFFIHASILGVSFAFLQCDLSKCKDSNPFVELGEVRYLPNAQQLRELCPKMIEFSECNKDVAESCYGQTIKELVNSSDKSVANAVRALLGVGSFVRDICNKHTTLHKNYVANVECFRGFSLVGTRLCQLETKDTLDEFFRKSSIEKGGLDDVLNADIECLTRAYIMTCVSLRLGDTCGELAQDTFVSALRRLKPALDTTCVGGTNSLKDQFLQYMEVNEEQMIKIKETFDLYRRR